MDVIRKRLGAGYHVFTQLYYQMYATDTDITATGKIEDISTKPGSG